MKVVTTDMSLRLGVKIKELGRVASVGEVLDVSESRYKVLSGDNRFKAVFVVKEQLMKTNQDIDAVKLYDEAVAKEEVVEPVEEPVVEEVVEEAIEEPVVEETVEEAIEDKPKRKRKSTKEVVEEENGNE